MSLTNTHQEGRISLVIHPLNTGQSPSVRAAVESFDVPRSTIRDRLRGCTTKRESQSLTRKLTSIEESTLVEWILSMDKRSYPPELNLYARWPTFSSLHASDQRLQTHPRLTRTGYNDSSNRRGELKSKYHRKYDHQRAQCEDPEAIRNWFALVRNTRANYGDY